MHLGVLIPIPRPYEGYGRRIFPLYLYGRADVDLGSEMPDVAR